MILAIDTATLQAGVAIVDESGACIAARSARVTTHSEELLAMIAGALDEAGRRPAELSAIACGAGPGSFTGLRIGLATAKGLCLATGRPLLLVSSLAALALRAPTGAIAVPCIDAWKGEVYAGFYRRGEGTGLLALEPEAVLAPGRLAAWLEAAIGGSAAAVHLVGDGAVRWPELLAPGVVAEDRSAPDAADVGRLAWDRFARGERDPLAEAVPSYIRPSEAEIKGPPPGLGQTH
jgi:tRNA threonylcarbamoyladenosine biosynthesis protein TsaB